MVASKRRLSVVPVASLLVVALLAGCSCPQASGPRGGRNSNSQDSSGSEGTFAFLGGVLGLFGDSSSAPSSTERRACCDADLSDKPVQSTDQEGSATGTAALTIR